MKLGNGILPGARSGLFGSQSIGDFSHSMILLHREHIKGLFHPKMKILSLWG